MSLSISTLRNSQFECLKLAHNQLVIRLMSTTKYFLLVIGLLGVAISASAVSTLRLTSGATTMTIRDGSRTDLNPAAGMITFNGFIGAWKVNIAPGVSGTTALPFLDIFSVDTSSSSSRAPADLRIEFSEIGFGPVGSGSLFNADINGVTQGTIGYKVWLDTSNTLFGHGSGTPLLNLGSFSGGSFSGAASTVSSVASALYSLTMEFNLSHSSLTKSSGFSASVEDPAVPDGGTTLMLLGASLSALCFFGRSRKLADKI